MKRIGLLDRSNLSLWISSHVATAVMGVTDPILSSTLKQKSRNNLDTMLSLTEANHDDLTVTANVGSRQGFLENLLDFLKELRLFVAAPTLGEFVRPIGELKNEIHITRRTNVRGFAP